MSLARDLPPFAHLPGGVAPLGYRNFLLYWLGFVASNAGKWIEQTGAVWVAYELTGSPFLLGLLGLIRAIPTIVLTPLAGVIADRVDPRSLVFVTQALAMLASLTLGLLIASGRLELWELYAQVGIQAAIGAVDAVGRQTLFPRLVPRVHMVEAVTLQSMAGRSSNLIGPAIGGVAIAALGNAAPFLLNAATFLALMGALALMRGVIRRSPLERAPFAAELAEGLRYILRTPVLRSILALEVFFGIFSMNQVMITIVARDELHVGPEGLGGLLSAGALGAVIGIIALLTIGATRRPGRFIVLTTIAYSAALVVFATAGSYVVAFVSLVVTGVFDAMESVVRNSLMQLAAPGRMRGRVMANQGTVVRGFSPLAQTQSGAIADAIGAPLAIVTAAVVLSAGVLGVLASHRALWSVTRDDILGGP